MSGKVLVIVGTSRPDGLHHKVLEELKPGANAEVIDLREKRISYYDYANDYPKDDDFIAIAEHMAAAESIIFATPVYWYAMSAQLKTFFDRFTDLVTTHKKLGRRLAGRNLHMLAWGHEPELPEGFEIPFASTADYLDMEYKGSFYYCTGPKADVERRGREAETFRRAIFG